MNRRRFLSLTAPALASLASGRLAAQPPARRPDVIYVPTPPEVVSAMLELAGLHAGDVVYDLGCGDGRIVVAAAKHPGVKAVGLEIDPRRVAEARANVAENGVESTATVRQEDIFLADLSPATVVTMYLLPTLNVRLLPKLARLRRGTRIVSHSFAMKGAKPKTLLRVRTPDGASRAVFLWVVPWEKE